MEKNETAKKQVLVALSGMSPAVVTETVWAMACSLEAPVVPDEVVVLTTKTGAEKLREMLKFDEENDEPAANGPWGELKKTLAKAGHDVKGKLILTGDTIKEFKGADRKSLDDLVTRADNLQAANLMMQVIRDYTDDNEWVVHAQLAGGRKTMSALFFSCMCLLGRPCDHIYHVLVDAGYDNPKLEPPFLFPQKGVVHKGMKDGKPIALKSLACRPNLFDVPYVPMGEWAEQKCRTNKRRRLSYESVIEAVNAEVKDDVYPKIEIDMSQSGRITINGEYCKTSHFEFVLFALVVQGACAADCLPLMRELKDFLCLGDYETDEFVFDNGRFKWLKKFIGDDSKESLAQKFAWYRAGDKKEEKVQKDFNRTLSDLRKAMPQTASMARLLSRDEFPSDFPCAEVVWSGYEGLPKEVLDRLFLKDTRCRLGL